MITLDEFEELGVAGTVAEIQSRVGDTPVYVSFDLDVLDLPWALGVADPEVGGLTIREALKVIRGMRGLQLVGADLVCMIPRKDGPGEVGVQRRGAHARARDDDRARAIPGPGRRDYVKRGLRADTTPTNTGC
ncbi:MAG TPA: arginase family protein [Solirubrobacteraceae bacterium]